MIDRFNKFLDSIPVPILIAVMAITSGGIGAMSKIALITIPPLSFVFIRLLIAMVLLLPIVWRELRSLNFGYIKSLFAVSLLATGNFVLYIFGVAKTSATISQTLYAATPLIVAVLSIVFLKEKVAGRKLAGLFLGLLGVSLIIILPALGKPNSANGTLVGNLLVISAVFCWSIYSVLSKKLQDHHSPLMVTFLMAASTVVVQSLLAPTELVSRQGWLGHVSLPSFLGVLYVGAIGTGIYYLLYQQVIKKASPVTASLNFYLMPVTSYIWAFFLINEKISGGFVVGALLALAGVYFVTTKGNDKDAESAS